MSANKLELIQSLEVTSNVQSVVLGGASWNNSYDSYTVIITGVVIDSPQEIHMHYLDSSNAQVTTNYSYSFQRSSVSTTSTETTVKATGANDIEVGQTNSVANSGASFNCEILLQDFNDASKLSSGMMDIIFQNTSAEMSCETGGFFNTTAAIHKGLEFEVEGSNNFTAGRFTLYGIGS